VADALSGFQTTFIAAKIGGRNLATEGDVRRRVERLLLRLDFNSEFSKPLLAESRSRTASGVHGENILKEGGLAWGLENWGRCTLYDVDISFVIISVHSP
jgi:hypothetical protein